MLPENLKPKTLYFEKYTSPDIIFRKINNHKIEFPIIMKPDIGERGWLVEKINNKEELLKYSGLGKVNFLIQEFVNSPIELAILYYRYPDQDGGTLLSVTIKEYLSIIGDGKSTIRDLIVNNKRAYLQLGNLEKLLENQLNSVLPNKQKKVLLEIGNHCKGTTFLNGNDIIDAEMTHTFDHITNQLNEVYFCRYDLKCNSIEEMKKGIGIQIFEINGVGSEPTHIYDPEYRFFDAWRDLLKTWNIIFKIGVMNKKRGVNYMSTKEVIKAICKLRDYKKQAQ